MRLLPRPSVAALFLLSPLTALAASASPTFPTLAITPKHDAGRCAFRGQCGSEGLLGPQLPCPDNDVAKMPDPALRNALVLVCGQEWADKDVCCTTEQVDTLKSNLQRANSFIASCPACAANFANLFCAFTCAPDQSLWVNITKVAEKKDKKLVTELDYLVSDKYAKDFYDSCKEVKFGGSNGKAMDLIGGGAKNPDAFLKFLGEKKFLGSPFQMNFPRKSAGDFGGMEEMDWNTRKCNDTDEKYRCACTDCPASCATLAIVKEDQHCYVGVLPCLSFAAILVYSIFLILLVISVSGHVAYQKHAKSRSQRLRLLQDAAPSDDEDEGDFVQNAAMLDRPQRHYYLNTLCDRAFSKLGHTCAEFPAITISMTVVLVIFLSLGWARFTIETDPVRLWVAPNAAAAQEKSFFDSNFGPFYRAEQAFLVNDTNGAPGPVLTYDTLKWWTGVEGRIRKLRDEHGTTLKDVCFKPVGGQCVIQSVTGYFQEDFSALEPETWAQYLQNCANAPVNCLPMFQQPLNPSMVYGKYDGNVLDAEALVTTWVVNNHPEKSSDLSKAMVFEQAMKDVFLDVQQQASDRGLRMSFTIETSVEEELNKSSNTDAKIVALSYVVMFFYVSVALGFTSLSLRSILRNPTNALVQSKFMIGIVAIVIVLMSVSASVGLFSALGVEVTLIIAEVIPFLVLAVGVDNVFLIVHEFERVNVSFPELTIPERMGKALGRMGPSILLAATTETVTFALGTAVGMPAVRNFAVYAAGAVFINALLQMTLFVSALALNQRRVDAGRSDCFPCVRLIDREQHDSHGMPHMIEDEGPLQKFIRKVYAPALMDNKVKVGIITVFLGIFAAGIALIPGIQLGLDQRIALPSDSYLINYFNDLDDYFGVGPPVYFVTKEVNATQRQHQKELCGRFLPCADYSLANTLENERKRSDVSYIADATASWVDDFFLWLNPTFDSCCVKRGSPCFETRNPPWSVSLVGMPEGIEYIDYLAKWLQSPTSEDCPLAGQAAYGNAVVIDSNRTTVLASHFRTSHTPLKNQEDFISAYKSARRIASDISKANNIEVFAYSKFYIFFDQYLSIVKLSATLLGSAAAFIFLASTILLGSLRTGIVVTATVAMIIVSVLGSMAVASVSLNAVSLVNLVISVGIALEFCAHIARAFSFPSASVMERAPRHAFISPTSAHPRHHNGHANANGILSTSGPGLRHSRNLRAWAALVNVGSSVFSGITLTKFLGVAVLVGTRSKIFEIYYFRMWVALVIFAAAHALIFLPVALSLAGGRGYVDPESEGGLEQDLRGRRQYPALLDDDYDSDDY